MIHDRPTAIHQVEQIYTCPSVTKSYLNDCLCFRPAKQLICIWKVPKYYLHSGDSIRQIKTGLAISKTSIVSQECVSDGKPIGGCICCHPLSNLINMRICVNKR